MKQYILKVISVEKVTHDVLQIRLEKPAHFQFRPGQATDLAINKEGWKNEIRPFTFTALPSADYLEFNIKTYPQHQGVTNQLLQLKPDDELIISQPWGTIAYKGPGVFIAGGAGITPFLAILRLLNSENKLADNKLIFANKTANDIIHKEEFENLLGTNFINILSDEEHATYAHGFISKDFLQQHLAGPTHYYYVCGPRPMMNSVLNQLHELGVKDEWIVKEEF
ncbi:MAG: FAD-binding oxidoreductase [Bacteroidales bacterium]|jgi:ferredoxin-NADP reductase|nr:FAD-binding oxidoreductase [Bacteroidales bacterium]MDD3701192.1 FAD-binding oxidoreductase [Bacteroidales bacterium]MDY0368639.1 FAD-binding oxidoreductase [Bacteroidales bacterium]